MLIDYWRFACAQPRFLGFGFIMAFLSSAGQTYFIGVFGSDIQAEFGLDAGAWGRTYMMGTLLSAIVINWSGSLIDRLDLRLFATISLVGLSIACLLIGWVSSPLVLIFAVFMLRQFGQGLTSHAGITSMARYHSNNRGKAIALAAIGFAFGEALLPVAGLYLAELWGWRQTFVLVAAVVFVSIAPMLWLLKGHGLRHSNHTVALNASADEPGSQKSYTRKQALSEFRFYLMLPAMIAPSMIMTAMFFFPAEIARAKGWSSLWITGNYGLYSFVSVVVTIYSGVIIDRYSAAKVIPVFLIPLALGLVAINIGDHRFLVWPFMLSMGITSGLYFTGFSALWAELYGPRYLGTIKSLTNAIMVFSSALGPALVGTLLGLNVSFLLITLILSVFCVFATLMLIVALRPKLRPANLQ